MWTLLFALLCVRLQMKFSHSHFCDFVGGGYLFLIKFLVFFLFTYIMCSWEIDRGMYLMCLKVYNPRFPVNLVSFTMSHFIDWLIGAYGRNSNKYYTGLWLIDWIVLQLVGVSIDRLIVDQFNMTQVVLKRSFIAQGVTQRTDDCRAFALRILPDLINCASGDVRAE